MVCSLLPPFCCHFAILLPLPQPFVTYLLMREAIMTSLSTRATFLFIPHSAAPPQPSFIGLADSPKKWPICKPLQLSPPLTHYSKKKNLITYPKPIRFILQPATSAFPHQLSPQCETLWCLPPKSSRRCCSLTLPLSL